MDAAQDSNFPVAPVLFLKPNTGLGIDDLLRKGRRESQSRSSTHRSHWISTSKGAMGSGAPSKGRLHMAHYAPTGQYTLSPAPRATTCDTYSTSDRKNLDSKDRPSDAMLSTSMRGPPDHVNLTKRRVRQSHACVPCNRRKTRCEFKEGSSVCDSCESLAKSKQCYREPRNKQTRPGQASRVRSRHLQVPLNWPPEGLGAHWPADRGSETFFPTEHPVSNLSSNVTSPIWDPMSTSDYGPSMNAHPGAGLAETAQVPAEFYARNATSHVTYPIPASTLLYTSGYDTSIDPQWGVGEAQTTQSPTASWQEAVNVADFPGHLVLRSSVPTAGTSARGGW